MVCNVHVSTRHSLYMIEMKNNPYANQNKNKKKVDTGIAVISFLFMLCLSVSLF